MIIHLITTGCTIDGILYHLISVKYDNNNLTTCGNLGLFTNLLRKRMTMNICNIILDTRMMFTNIQNQHVIDIFNVDKVIRYFIISADIRGLSTPKHDKICIDVKNALTKLNDTILCYNDNPLLTSRQLIMDEGIMTKQAHLFFLMNQLSVDKFRIKTSLVDTNIGRFFKIAQELPTDCLIHLSHIVYGVDSVSLNIDMLNVVIDDYLLSNPQII